MIDLRKGDCLKLMLDIPSESIDAIICDLPYGTTACMWDGIISLPDLWEQYNRIIKKRGAIILTASQPFTTTLISSNKRGFAFAWVWDKKFAANFVQAKRQPLKVHEDVLIFSKDGKQPLYYPQMIKRENPITNGGNKMVEAIPIARTEASKAFEKKKKVYNEKFPTSILKFNVRIGRGLHPTQKPVALIEYLIKTYTKEGDIVLDNTMGSGTTGVACVNTNRNFIGIEMDDKYFEIAQKRISEAVMEKQQMLF